MKVISNAVQQLFRVDINLIQHPRTPVILERSYVRNKHYIFYAQLKQSQTVL